MTDLMQDSVDDRLLREVVMLQLPSGRARYLIQVLQEPCEECCSGTRVNSIWVSAQGQGESVAWCSHCFNATCEPIALDEDGRKRVDQVQAAIAAGRVSQAWRAARPAVEDLRRRGLL
jgi:hypothetical protein